MNRLPNGIFNSPFLANPNLINNKTASKMLIEAVFDRKSFVNLLKWDLILLL